MPLVWVKQYCKEVVIPDKKGNPVGGITCKWLPVGQKPPPGYVPTGLTMQREADDLAVAPEENEEETTMDTTTTVNMNDILHCPSIRTSIELQNKGANVTTALAAALAGGASIDLDIPQISLLRTLRFVYFSTSLANPDDVDVTLVAGSDGVQPTVISPTWSGGELAPSNANACSAYNCKDGYCLGALDQGIIRLTNTSAGAIPIGTTFKFKFLYDYKVASAMGADAAASAAACACQTG